MSRIEDSQVSRVCKVPLKHVISTESNYWKMRSNKIGLALSGGGYRATAYHIGTFRALKKMGLLEKIGVISTNSGGSITGACYALYHRDYEQFEKTVLEGVKKSVIKSIITSWMFYVPTLIILSSLLFGICLMFTSYAWVSLAILITALLVILFFQFKIITYWSPDRKSL